MRGRWSAPRTDRLPLAHAGRSRPPPHRRRRRARHREFRLACDDVVTLGAAAAFVAGRRAAPAIEHAEAIEVASINGNGVVLRLMAACARPGPAPRLAPRAGRACADGWGGARRERPPRARWGPAMLLGPRQLRYAERRACARPGGAARRATSARLAYGECALGGGGRCVCNDGWYGRPPVAALPPQLHGVWLRVQLHDGRVRVPLRP